jgi:hypothetical protein
MSTRKKAGAEFAEWATLFPKGLFVHVVVYADESGTHDETGKQRGSREATVAGIAALREDWIPFCTQWAKVLKDYDAPYFHYKKWRAAEVRAQMKRPPKSKQEDPYPGWNIEKLNAFAVELARVAGSGNKLIIGNYVHTSKFYQSKIKWDIPIGANPYKHCIDGFFASFVEIIGSQRAPWKRLPITFVFDSSEKPEWRHAIDDAFHSYNKSHPRSWFVWGDEKLPENLPLQAADMVAWRSRIATEGWVDRNFDTYWPELDSALFKPMLDWMTANKEIMLRYFLSGEAFKDDTYTRWRASQIRNPV